MMLRYFRQFLNDYFVVGIRFHQQMSLVDSSHCCQIFDYLNEFYHHCLLKNLLQSVLMKK